MAAFTMTLKEALESTGGTWDIGPEGFAVVTGGRIGIDHFPIFDEAYRPRLRGLIFDRYMNREIAHETVEDFAQRMRTTLNEIMPVYNQWYESTKLEFDPFKTIDMRTLSVGTAQQESETEGNSSSNALTKGVSRARNNDFPQTELVDGKEYASSGSRADSETENTGDAMESGTSKVDSSSDSDVTVSGYQGLPSDMLMRLRESFVNVDRAILNDLHPLFIGIWNTSDSFTRNGYYL